MNISGVFDPSSFILTAHSDWCSDLSCDDQYMVSTDVTFVQHLDLVYPSVTSSYAPLVKINLKSDLCLFSHILVIESV